MLWVDLIRGILELDVVEDEIESRHHGRKNSISGRTKGKIYFTLEIVDDQLVLVFEENKAEKCDVFAGRKVVSVSVRGQEEKIIRRVAKILRKKKMFFSFDEIESQELKQYDERKVIWNQGHVYGK